MVQEEGADAALGEDRQEERVEDWEDAEDGEGDADVGYYVGCAGHDERGSELLWQLCPINWRRSWYMDRYVVLERRVSSDDMVSSGYFEGFVSILIAERSTPMLLP